MFISEHGRSPAVDGVELELVSRETSVLCRRTLREKKIHASCRFKVPCI